MTPELEDMLRQLEAIKKEGQTVAAGLNDAQFNWRPAPGRWSIAECLQHLNVGVRATLPAFDRAIAEGRAQGKLAPGRGPFRYGLFSRMMASSMEPPPRFRMRTQTIFAVAPNATYKADRLLPEFFAVRDLLGERVRAADGLDLARIRAVSPANRLIRPSLGAYLQFMLAHDRRHLWQARQVRDAPGFGGTSSQLVQIPDVPLS